MWLKPIATVLHRNVRGAIITTHNAPPLVGIIVLSDHTLIRPAIATMLAPVYRIENLKYKF